MSSQVNRSSISTNGSYLSPLSTEIGSVHLPATSNPPPSSQTSSQPTMGNNKDHHKRNGPLKATTNSVKKAGRGVKKAVKSILPNDDDYRWEELQDIEKRRRQILLNVEEPTWKVLMHWDGTVLRILAFNPLLWITLAIYVALRLFARNGMPDYISETASNSMTILGGFLSFFLVFYVNQNHKRFFHLYNQSMSCKGRIFDVATLAVTTLPFAQASRLVRYMNAAHAAGYVGLSEIYPSGSYFNQACKSMGLLTDEERERLDDIDLDKGGSCNREIIAWCMNEIQTARSKQLLDPELANLFREQILQLRSKLGQPYDAKDLPIPFFYVHFICLLTTLYLPLFAVTSAIEAGTGDETHWSAGLISGIVVLLQAIFVIGLRVLGQKMSDPYGDDLIDLSVMYYINFTWTHSNRILNAHFPEEAAASVEAHLIAERESVGKAWEPEKHDEQSSDNDSLTATNTSTVMGGEPMNKRIIPNPRL